MEDASTAAQHNVVFGSEVVRKARPRIELSRRAIQQVGRKRFELVAQAVVHAEAVGRAPVVLNIETSVGVTDVSFGLVAHCAGNFLPLKYSRIEGRLSKRWRFEPLEEEHLARACLQTEGALDREQALEISFKRI